MSPDIVERVKGFLLNPVETFRTAHGDDLGEALKYFVAILAVNAVLIGLMTMAGFGALPGMGAGGGIVAGISAIIGGIIGGIIGLFVVGLIIHIFVALIIGGNGLGETIKALAYAATPGMLLGWIPILGFLAYLWTVALAVIGIREIHDTTTGKAAVAVFMPVIILFVLFVAFLAYFTISPSFEVV
ncbi:hypothetical protein RJ40_05620 [Methanofollis aquaemaris]|uniref:Yip1 domain-containing protein n=1 Tax=Methanofollis aquaemaris TaxID=126734 RepID=A0A8A3S4D6_9EURY|nr:YIP1 family protein [Methanofollis aquaemaris]QSZ67008.1 hypothetical protein RJ40_05620 [Methanofollis aquaemaris]